MPPALAPDQTTPSDAELAQRIGAGDQRAFELLMRRHNQLLFRTARSILHDDAEAEDVVQDTYLLAYRAIGQFRGDARLSTWLTRIVVNEAIARSRKTTRQAKVIRLHPDGDINNEIIEADMTDAATESAERQAMRAQARHLLEASIDALPEAFRTVFVLRAVEEMSGEEVARCLDIPEATVRSRFFRARSQLRTSLLAQFDLAFEDVFSFDGARCDRIVAAVLAQLPPSPSGPA
jgi:RNA polymerase sigma-70 factor (ECF subfamily)